MFIIAGQVLMFLASLSDNTLPGRAMLVWDLVLTGEVWRLLTFFFVPPTNDVIFLIFAYLIFYTMGTALERYWGVVRYNAFLFLGAALTSQPPGLFMISRSRGGFFKEPSSWRSRQSIPNLSCVCSFSFPSRLSGWRCCRWRVICWQCWRDGQSH